uniref:Calponin-homology (CH) domain-containing protein n=1 Tax=Malurus cyaneus samueli TaxID=2593467 RepID=A0A8C5TM25_9PASS
SSVWGSWSRQLPGREAVQKKTFTKWVNSHLARVTCRISDLYMDLRDGRVLIKLLEVLSGELLPKPTKGRMRIHCLENVDKALQFLKEQRVHLENMGSHDIVDGNHRLVLGLIWTIILRFQVEGRRLGKVGSGTEVVGGVPLGCRPLMLTLGPATGHRARQRNGEDD